MGVSELGHSGERSVRLIWAVTACLSLSQGNRAERRKPLRSDRSRLKPDYNYSPLPGNKGVTVNTSARFLFRLRVLTGTRVVKTSLFCFPFWIHIKPSTYSSCYLYEQILTQDFLVAQYGSDKGGDREITRSGRGSLLIGLNILQVMLDKSVTCCKQLESHGKNVNMAAASHTDSSGRTEEYRHTLCFYFPHV